MASNQIHAKWCQIHNIYSQGRQLTLCACISILISQSYTMPQRAQNVAPELVGVLLPLPPCPLLPVPAAHQCEFYQRSPLLRADSWRISGSTSLPVAARSMFVS